MKPFSTLKGTLLVNTLFVAALPLIVFGLISLQFVGQDLEKKIQQQHLYLARSASAEALQYLSHLVQDSESLASLLQANKFTDRRHLEVFLAAQLHGAHFFESVAVYDRSGRGRLASAASDKRGETVRLLDNELVRAAFLKAGATSRHQWSDTFFAPGETTPSVALAMPAGKWTILGRFSLGGLYGIVKRIAVDNGYAYIVNREGVLIAHPDPRLVARKHSLTYLPIVRDAIAGKFGTSRYTFRGIEREGSIVPISETGWLVAVAQTVDEAYAPLLRIRTALLAGIALTLLFAILSAIWSLGRLLHPLVVLGSNVQSIAGGNYSLVPQPSGFKELDDLAGHVSVMAEAVNQREEELALQYEELAMTEEELRQQVDEYHKSQDDLCRTNYALQALFDAAPVAIVALDLEGRVTTWNPAAELIFGWGAAETIGRPLPFTAPEAMAEQRRDSGPLSTEAIICEDFRHRKKDGTGIDLRFSSSILRDPQGEVTGLLAIYGDITEHKKAEEALRQSEEKYRSLVENMSDLVWETDTEGTFTYISPNVYDVLGYRPDEIIGRKCMYFMEEWEGKRAERIFAEYVRHRTPFNYFENVFLDRSGDPFTFESNGTPIIDSNGEMLGFRGICRNISERKLVEDALRRSEEFFRLTFDQSTIGAAIIDRRFDFLRVNAELCRITGYSDQELLAKSVTDIEHDDDHASAVWAERLLSGEIGHYRTEQRYRNKEGEIVWVNLSVRLLRDATRDDVVFFSLMEEITDRKRAEEEIRMLNAELERRVAERTAQLELTNRELESFSYSVSHDLRAPLRHIDGFSYALMEEYQSCLDDKGRDYLRRVSIASRRMGRLIDDLLNLSRVSRGEISKKSVDLSSMVRQTAEELRSAQPDREVELRIAGEAKVNADPRLMKVVIDNLVGNAWKYTGKKDKAEIEFGMTGQDGTPVLYIRDNGAGFDMTYADKLFGAFQRLHRDDEFEGTGIGLVTVQRIIHRHGGRIWAEAQPGEGATFYFTLSA